MYRHLHMFLCNCVCTQFYVFINTNSHLCSKKKLLKKDQEVQNWNTWHKHDVCTEHYNSLIIKKLYKVRSTKSACQKVLTSILVSVFKQLKICKKHLYWLSFMSAFSHRNCKSQRWIIILFEQYVLIKTHIRKLWSL